MYYKFSSIRSIHSLKSVNCTGVLGYKHCYADHLPLECLNWLVVVGGFRASHVHELTIAVEIALMYGLKSGC